MKRLFATGVIYIFLFILLIAGIYNLGKNFNESIVQDDGVVVTTEEIQSNNKVWRIRKFQRIMKTVQIKWKTK